MPTLTPTGGTTACPIYTGSFPNTYDGNTSTLCCFSPVGSCLSEWYWDTLVNVTKLNLYTLNFYLNSDIYQIWGRVEGSWVELWSGTWVPSNGWSSKSISCNNCTGIRIGQYLGSQQAAACINEVSVDYEMPPPCSSYTNQSDCEAAGCYWYNGSCHSEPPSCEDYTTQAECEATGCYWYNGSCHSGSPSSCEILNNQSDCMIYGCYWYNGSCHTDPQSQEWTLDEALTCEWVNGYNDHGPMVTEFDIDQLVYAYSEIHGPDMYGHTARHEWWYKEAGATEFTKRWEYDWTCGGHYTEWAQWTWWEIGGAYGPGEGYIKVYFDDVYMGKTNNYTVTGPVGAIGNIAPQSTYYTGPFNPGDEEYIMRVFYGNRYDAGEGTIYYNLYEYPNTPSENLLQANQRIMYPGQTETWYQLWIIPDISGSWPLGIKVWGDGESEPPWGAMGTKIFKIHNQLLPR